MIGKVPSLFGVTVILVVIPGTASCFCPNSGTQNEWMTSRARSVNRVGRSIGSLRMFVVRSFCCGYLNVQANCCAVTSTLSGFEPVCSLRANTTAEMIAIDVTRTNGIAVHATSRPVWP